MNSKYLNNDILGIDIYIQAFEKLEFQVEKYNEDFLKNANLHL